MIETPPASAEATSPCRGGNLFSLEGKTAAVTGGGRGIGRGAAMALKEAGADVLIIGSSERTADRALDMGVKGIRYDLSKLDGIPALFEEARLALGGEVDILVNDAAVQYRCDADQFPLDEFQRVIDVNLTATFLLCREAGRHMKRRGYGKIINMASMTSFFGSYRIAAYAASKGGVMQLTKAFSNELAPFGVNVNAIAPGGFETEMTKALWTNDETNAQTMSRTPAGRWGRPDDVAGSVIFLASKASDYVCGAVLPVDGGYLVR